MAASGTPLPSTILVAFATANTGSKVVEYLSQSKDNVAIRGLVRNPDKPQAQALAGLPNVTLVKGDIEDAASLSAALKGVSRVFLVTGPGEASQYDREVTFLKAAKEAGVEAIVRISTSSMLISLDTECVYGRAHARIDEYIEQHKSPVIDLRPDCFMSNWLGSAGEVKAQKTLHWPVQPESFNTQKLAMIDPRDIAGAAAALLLLPSERLAKFLEAGKLEIHGPQSVSFADQLRALEDAIGHKIEHRYIPPETWVQAAMAGFGMTKLHAESLCDSLRVAVGEVPPAHPPIVYETSAILLDVYRPKYTVQDWAKDSKEAFL